MALQLLSVLLSCFHSGCYFHGFSVCQPGLSKQFVLYVSIPQATNQPVTQGLFQPITEITVGSKMLQPSHIFGN